MSWGLGWKRPSEIFHLTLNYGTEEPPEILGHDSSLSRSSSASSHSSSSSTTSQETELGFRINLDWSASEDDDQVALKLQSQLMVALPMPQDSVVVELKPGDDENVGLDMKVVKRREPLKAITMTKAIGSGQQSDGIRVLTRLIRSNLSPLMPTIGEGVTGCGDHWKSVSLLSICGCNLSVSFRVRKNWLVDLFPEGTAFSFKITRHTHAEKSIIIILQLLLLILLIVHA